MKFKITMKISIFILVATFFVLMLDRILGLNLEKPERFDFSKILYALFSTCLFNLMLREIPDNATRKKINTVISRRTLTIVVRTKNLLGYIGFIASRQSDFGQDLNALKKEELEYVLSKINPGGNSQIPCNSLSNGSPIMMSWEQVFMNYIGMQDISRRDIFTLTQHLEAGYMDLLDQMAFSEFPNISASIMRAVHNKDSSMKEFSATFFNHIKVITKLEEYAVQQLR